MTIDGEEKPFYDDEEKEHSDDEDNQTNETAEAKEKRKIEQEAIKNKPQMDPDHRLLLKNCRPLLQSRSASVSTANN